MVSMSEGETGTETASCCCCCSSSATATATASPPWPRDESFLSPRRFCFVKMQTLMWFLERGRRWVEERLGLLVVDKERKVEEAVIDAIFATTPTNLHFTPIRFVTSVSNNR